MRAEEIFAKARDRATLTREEAYWLWDEAPLERLAAVADEVRRNVVPDENVVTWQIDRNVNITNVCISGCKFCNFHCKPHQIERKFITTIEEYKEKIERYEEEAAQVLQNQDIPEEIYYKFNFHDADVLALKKIRSDVELYLNRDGMQLEGETPYTKVIFKNVSMLDREKGLVFRKKRKNDGEIGSSCQFLYHELYRTAEYYEVHMMFWTPKALRYLTIKCGDIEIVDNIVQDSIK